MSDKKLKKDLLIQKLLDLYEKDLYSSWKIRPPLKERKDDYLSRIHRLEGIRGRALLYPYMGAGRGKGVYVELLDGSCKMDLLGGVGVQILGHGRLDLIRVLLKAGLSDVFMQGHLLINQEYLVLSEKLISLSQKNSRLKHVWLCPSGSMANENALKMARQKNSPRRKILAFDRAFAGRTTIMSEITANPKVRQGLPAYDEVLRLPFYSSKDPGQSLRVLKKHLKAEADNIAVFIFEIVCGEGGFCSAPPEFFTDLFKECRAHGIFIWADEVQTFLRTGEFFAFEKWGLGEYIDLLTVGKGLQLSATFFTEELKPAPGLVSGTFSASVPAMAIGLKVLETLEKGYMGKFGRIAEVETAFRDFFHQLKKKSLIRDFDVFGLMSALSLPKPEKTLSFLKELFQRGLIALSCGNPARVRFLSPAVIQDEDIEEFKKVLTKALKDFKKDC